METRIEHIGIAVKDIQKGIALYRDLIGLPVVGEVNTYEKAGLQTVFFKTGESTVELLAPMKNPPRGTDGEMIANFIKTRGEGIHHVAFAVDDIKGMMSKLEKNGVTLVDKVPRPGGHGSIAFLDQSSTYGAFLELCQPDH